MSTPPDKPSLRTASPPNKWRPAHIRSEMRVMHTDTHRLLGCQSTLHAPIDARCTWLHRQTRPATDLAADQRHRWAERSAPPGLLFPTQAMPRPGPDPPGIIHPMGKAFSLFILSDGPMGELYRSSKSRLPTLGEGQLA